MKKLNSLDALSQLLDLAKPKSDDKSTSNFGQIQKELVTLRIELTKINKQRDIVTKQINKLVISRRNIQNKERRVLKANLPSTSINNIVKVKKPVKKKKK
jgi:flagellar biosynthesis chaperone FliJ